MSGEQMTGFIGVSTKHCVGQMPVSQLSVGQMSVSHMVFDLKILVSSNFRQKVKK
jgi:hypothetical protein